MTKEEEARKLFREGYNCAQSVLIPFAEEIGLSREQAARLASSFGGGMGKMREVCGAVSSLFMIKGLLEGYAEPDDEAKAAQYAHIRAMAEQFKAEHGSILCRELVRKAADKLPPEARTEAYYAHRPCEKFVGTAAAMAEEILQKHS